jgi:hypothetical protein
MKSFASLFFFLLLAGCGENKDLYVKYKSFEFDVDNITVSLEASDYDFQKSDSGTRLRYCVKSECVGYWLRDSVSAYISETGDTLDLLFANEEEYRINDSVYVVKKFTLDRNAIDSESQHYWSPEFGIILIKTTTWGGFKIMTQTSRGSQDVLNTLTTVLLKDVLVQNVNQKSEVIDSLTSKVIEDELK